jgi:hypothetical protein
MTQAQGSNVRILFDTEDVFKTNPTPISGEILPFVSEGLRFSRNLIDSKSIRSSRNPQQPVRGNADVAGDITFELAPQYGRLMQHIYGVYGCSVTGQMSTHSFTIGNLPAGMVIEKQFTDIAVPKYFRYNGCKINSFKLSAKSEGMIECSVSIMGAKETVGSSSMGGTVVDRGFTPFDGFDASLTKDGVTLAGVTSFDFTIENNLDGASYVIGGAGERDSLPAGTAKVSGSLTAIFDSTTLYDLAIANTEVALVISFAKGTGAGTAGNESMVFTFDEVILKPQAPVVSGPAGVLVELPFEAYYSNATAASAARLTLKTTTVTYV